MWRPNSSHETNGGFAHYELEGRVQLVRIVVCWEESPLNMIIKPPPSNGNFTQIPNEIIHLDIPMAEKLIWMQLRSLCPAREDSYDVGSLAKIGERFGLSARNAQKLFKALVTAKLAAKDGDNIILLLPGSEWEAPSEKQEQSLNVRQQVRDVWNEFCPKSYVKLRKPVASKLEEAIVAHMEHLEVKGNPADFVKQVLAGAKAHDRFWANANARPEWIFGSGDPTEKKFSNTETLYKLGISKAGQSAAFNPSDDRSWVEWFALKGSPEYVKVKRVQVSNRFDALDNEIELKESGKLTGDTIRVYSDEEGRVIYWTGQNLPQFRYLP